MTTPRNARIFASIVGLAGLGWLGVMLWAEGSDVALSATFWAFAGLIILAEVRPIHHRRSAGVVLWSLSTPFMFALLLYRGAAVAALVSASASVITDLLRRAGWDRVLFNAGQYVLGLGAAGLILAWGGYVPGALLQLEAGAGTLWPLLPAAAVFLVVTEALVAAVVALAGGGKFLDIFVGEFRLSGPIHAVLLAMAPVIAVIAGVSLALLLPLVLLVLGIHQWTRVLIEKEHQSEHDLLTGLPNRILFERSLEGALRTGTRTTGPAVLLMDLNGFRDVNETLGHQAGDDLLRTVADRLMEALAGDVVVGRLGGDEFAVLLPAVSDPDEAVEATVGLQAILRQPISIDGFSLDVSASVGVAAYPEHGRDADTLLRRAEAAMYAAKDKHGGVEVYRHERDEHSRRRLALVHDLRKAVEAGDLGVSYQPKADLKTGEIVSMEALVRWDHPEHGPISPDEFIPLAERTGLIAPLTAQVLKMALDECARWHQARFALGVAVNLSPAAMFDRGLQRTAWELISMWELAPGWLELEITESTIMADPEQARRVLDNTADLGVRLSIDDFGTGYSSLGLLKQLPVHELKVDKSFVQNIVHDASDAAIVGTTVKLARSLGMTVCAEGVETEASWQRLVELECDLAQGYLLSRPIPGPDVMAWLLARIPGPETWAPTAGPVQERPADETSPVVTFTPRRRAT